MISQGGIFFLYFENYFSTMSRTSEKNDKKYHELS